MGLIKLNAAEKKLFRDVEHGDPTDFAGDGEAISAEVLRHIVLGLPLVKRRLGAVFTESVCKTTGAGISLSNANIAGRLRLDAAIGCHGGPLCPLEFRDCTFTEGCSAAHAHFSRLSFRNCTFADRGEPIERARHRPTLDLTGARLDGQLDMDGVGPWWGYEALFWIRASGIRVGGGISLSGSTLCAPYRPTPEDPSGWTPSSVRGDALDLSLGEIGGDLSLDEGIEVRGRLKLRGTKVEGDMWLDQAVLHEPGEEDTALFLQGTRIKGFLAMRCPGGDREKVDCHGNINLVACEIGRSLLLTSFRMEGNIRADDVIVRDDFCLLARVDGRVDLERASIGGSLDISELRVKPRRGPPATNRKLGPATDRSQPVLSLKDGRIGGALRLTTKKAGARPLSLSGTINLEGLTCDTLEDELGRRWGKNVLIKMNHFTYNRTDWLSVDPEESQAHRKRKTSQMFVGHWLLCSRADGRGLWRWFPRFLLPEPENFWEPWQLRRNWIYQQYESHETKAAMSDPYLSITRHEICQDEYHPQPLEQAIRVARAEGREDSATHFEMHKQYLEWKLFNSRVRWGLGLVGIALAALWLVIGKDDDRERDLWALFACVVTITLMIFGSALRDMLCRHLVLPALVKPRRALNGVFALAMTLLLGLAIPAGAINWIVGGVAALAVAALLILGGCLLWVRWATRPEDQTRSEWVAAKSSKFLTWVIYWIPAAILLAAFWIDAPFRFFIALLIFMTIRCMGILAHQLMRFGFGYLRQPIRAVVTLIVAFLIGWWGVGLANSRHMFVVAAAPLAGLVGEAEIDNEAVQLSGSERVDAMEIANEAESEHESTEPTAGDTVPAKAGLRDVSCSHEISEPLYALDVLVPIVDLGEETRCEVRRFSAPGHKVVKTEELKLYELWEQRGDWPLKDNRFWWWMKALYSIFGWILVSLALLTFAQVNRTHGEPAE